MKDTELTETFADGIDGLAYAGGLVRFDLVSYSAIEREADGRPRVVARRHVVMPPQGFLELFQLIEDALERRQLTAAPGAADAVVDTPPERPSTDGPSTVPNSPNFPDD